MTPDQIQRVKSSFDMVRPIANEAAGLFYDRLFQIAPDLKPMFPEDLTDQKKKLIAVLATAVGALDRIETLLPVLHTLGAKHVGYGVKSEHYAPVGAALLQTLETGLGDAWTAETAEAWQEAYAALSAAMLEGAADVSARAA